MKNNKLNVGDLVFIKSAINGQILESAGCAMVIELTFGMPQVPGYTSPRETCTLLWNGVVENHIDTDWITKLSSPAPENFLAAGENDEKDDF